MISLFSTLLAAEKFAPTGITNPAVPALGSDREAAESGELLSIIIGNTLAFIMVIAALLVLLNIVEAGINWLSSGGDTGKVKAARDRITHAVIGIIILAAAMVVWGLVKTALGIQLNFPVLFGDA